MAKRRIIIAVVALIGAVLGAVLGALSAAGPSRYVASANIALLPMPNLTTEEASSFWEVLTRGQVTRTAAVVYDDPRWLTPAAEASGVPAADLTLTAAAVPDTTMLSVTVTAATAGAAESALNSVLTAATPEVSSLAAPYFVKVLWPPPGSTYPEATLGRLQLGAAGAFGGMLIGAGIAWFVLRLRAQPDADRDGVANPLPQ